jgi:glutaminyl-tRNA synthetase
MPEPEAATPSLDFIRQIVEADVKDGRHDGRVHTRFPPEPNGYLHIGHAKSICLNFGVAHDFNGTCNLRMDDTNPTKEDVEYVDSITEDVKWLIQGWADDRLGLKPSGKTPETVTTSNPPDFFLPAVKGAAAAGVRLEPFYASDYFDQIYEYALRLIRKGKAYVCDLTPEQTDRYRGAPDSTGKESPWRNRSIEENLDLFQRMKAGEFPDGARTLRARIDMAAPNVWMRDPVLYRIRHADHHHTGGKWCIYPMYDFAHCLSDYIEGITHSICTLEFEVHRPLYDWILEALDLSRPLPHQYEFARLNLTWTVMSKRKLLQLVQEKHVRGWDDPRMPTIAGLRRRGYTPEAIRMFCEKVGVAKRENVIELSLLEYCLRQDLEVRARRVMGVLHPLRVVLENYPENQTEEFEVPNHPTDASMGSRKVPFSRTLYIEQDDFRENPPKKYFRLVPGGEVRLRCAYLIKCEKVVKDDKGQVMEVRCTYDPATRGGTTPDGRKVKGTIHWVSAAHAIPAEVRLYNSLFLTPDPADESDGRDFKSKINPESLETVTAQVEPGLKGAAVGMRCQFERMGYFCLDPDSAADHLVFNRTVPLKDTWAKIEKAG